MGLIPILSPRSLLTVCLGLAVWFAAPSWCSAAPIPPQELEAFVDGVVSDGMTSEHLAGVSVAVVQDGKVIFLKGYGIAAPGRPVDPRRDVFRIASLSKTFTWIALMREVEQGRIRLDAPVNDYLPPELKIPEQGFQRPIRIIDLLSHSAGFEDSVLGHLLVDRPERITSLERYLVDHRPRRVREPGVISTYSNYGAALAGYIAARSAHRDYPTLLEQDLFDPLGMTSTTFREPYPPRPDLPVPMAADLRARLATGFDWQSGEFQPRGFEYLTQDAPIGGASTTAADMSRYMLMMLNDGVLGDARIYGPKTARAFRTPILKVPPGVNGWAYGWRVGTLPGGYRTYGHNGALLRFFSCILLVPELKLGVFVNTNTAGGGDLTERLPKLIVEQFYPAPPSRLRRPGDPRLVSQAGLYAGRYITTRRSYTGLEKFLDLLESDDHVRVTPSGYLVLKVGRETTSWVPDGPAGHFVAAEGDQRLVFSLDGRGRATGFPTARGGASEERAPWLLDNVLFKGAAISVLIAAVGCWLWPFNSGWRSAPSIWARQAMILRLATASFWLIAIAIAIFWCFGRSPDLMDGFPSLPLLLASCAAVLASMGSLGLAGLGVATVVLRPDGRTLGCEGAKALVTASFLLFALILAARGGLTPWL